LGDKRWKRRKITEAIVVTALSIMTTILVITGIDSAQMRIFDLFPIAGAWLGYNLGEIVRIKNL